MATVENYLDRYLEPLTHSLSADVAQSILELRPDTDVAARVTELGRKSNEGTLSPEEFDEYQALANAGTLVALLKAKARRFLNSQPG